MGVHRGTANTMLRTLTISRPCGNIDATLILGNGPQ
ncbi:MAG: hypothetical protein RLZZ524_2354 [Pseudomonadota bacterium]